MGWFSNHEDDKKKQLIKRDWSSGRASQTTNSSGRAYGTVETHERLDGTYLVEKDSMGNVISVKKK
ncbi:MAG TPA: hypothetical protein VKZ53_28460 [Candidatus Angelobacter sp.]|nr:hypothetical protein [Candidatus Angelobacter sp.]